VGYDCDKYGDNADTDTESGRNTDADTNTNTNTKTFTNTNTDTCAESNTNTYASAGLLSEWTKTFTNRMHLQIAADG
jgi:hypothetical protein